ncbi:MAG: SDR family oxidoreductase [Elusimicrobia bacterium]|nr:SDR family oxidoreductase [Elusimicrobiota bacterium]
MRILITGGAGFLGSHLAEHFLGQGHEVIVLDNFITGTIENIKGLLNHPDFTFKKQDVTDYIEVSGRLDAVFHFASPASPVDYAQYPIQTLKAGALGTHKTLGLAKDKKAAYVLASTSEVYGDPLVSPQPESYWGNVNPIGPRGVYDEAKRFAEAMAMAYHRTHRVKVHIARIFNTYGPRMRKNDGRAVPNFITQAIANKPITVYGRGRQTRSLCFVTDLVRGLDKLLHSSIHTPVNIGNPDEHTILELARLIKRLTGSKSRIVFNPLPVDDPKVRRPDIRLAVRQLRWKPAIPLEDGLKRTIEYFRN